MSPARFRDVRSPLPLARGEARPLILPYPAGEFVPEDPAATAQSRSPAAAFAPASPPGSRSRLPAPALGRIGVATAPAEAAPIGGTPWGKRRERAGAERVQMTFIRTSAPSVNAPGTSGSHTVMMR